VIADVILKTEMQAGNIGKQLNIHHLEFLISSLNI